jgi:UDPglucose 6-dehydrogenase
MKISIYGVGYVGLVAGVCLASLGHDVCCFDIDDKKITALQAGEPPIYEAQLEEMLTALLAAQQISFTHDFKTAAKHGVIQIIAVGTPPKSDGSADLSHVKSLVTRLSKTLTDYAVIVNKSTVPVGTADYVQKKMGSTVDVVSNPEFLREGCAIDDFLHPDRIIIGAASQRAIDLMRTMYQPLLQQDVPLLVMDQRSSELSKYASNAFLATKISFINEMSHIAEGLGADISQIQKAMGSDSRIAPTFLNPGCGYGGSCFPKDVSALEHMAQDISFRSFLLEAVEKSNRRQKSVLFRKIQYYFEGDLQDCRIALWGLAFKPGTDDIRSAPSLVLLKQLIEAGVSVSAYDPMAMDNVRQYYDGLPLLRLCQTKEAALQEADALVIVTDWDEFKAPDFDVLQSSLKEAVIFDGRNLYDPLEMAQRGFSYFDIGRSCCDDTISGGILL